jgi:hypothetical protein
MTKIRMSSLLQAAEQSATAQKNTAQSAAVEDSIAKLVGLGIAREDKLGEILAGNATSPESALPTSALEVSAGAFLDGIDRNAWSSRLRDTLDSFRMYFCGILWEDSEENLKRRYMIDDRDDAAKKLTEDLNEVLQSLVASSKDLRCCDESKRNHWDTPMELADGANTVPTQIDIPFSFELAAGASSNRRPVSGVLFPVGRKSEAIPAIGPGMKLFVPEAVAIAAMSQIGGLPLDASDTLDRHAKSEIVGVMNSAQLIESSAGGSDFMVTGHLWPWSQTKKVASIAANRDILGMSMNANASGHVETIDGEQVYQLDRIEFLGANILAADKATFKTTKLIEAQSEPDDVPLDLDELDDLDDTIEEEESGDALDDDTESEEASDDLEIDLDDDDDDDETLGETESDDLDESTDDRPPYPTPESEELQMSELADKFEDFSNRSLELTGALAESVQMLLADFQERKDEEELQAAAQELADSRESKQSLVEDVTASVMAALQASGVIKSAARNVPPARRTMPLSASAAVDLDEEPSSPRDKQIHTMELQLAAIDGEMKAIDSMPIGQVDNSVLFDLVDKRAALVARLQG